MVGGGFPMTLHIHRAERADTLAAALAELLTEPLDDVFAEEVVAVPARGIERWLTQRMSHHLGARSGRHDGICAASVSVADQAAGGGGERRRWRTGARPMGAGRRRCARRPAAR